MKNRISYLIVFIVSLSFATCWAQQPRKQDNNDEIDFLYDFLQGSYYVLGKSPDSDRIYSGTIIVKRTGNGLEVRRKIGNREIKGHGKIETATADKRKVLRIRFVEGKKSYEATYIIGSDLDNYARLTGYVYLKEGKTKTPGLEALFAINHITDKE